MYFVVKENNNETENFHVFKLYFGRYVAKQISVKSGNSKEHGHSRSTRRQHESTLSMYTAIFPGKWKTWTAVSLSYTLLMSPNKDETVSCQWLLLPG